MQRGFRAKLLEQFPNSEVRKDPGKPLVHVTHTAVVVNGDVAPTSCRAFVSTSTALSPTAPLPVELFRVHLVRSSYHLPVVCAKLLAVQQVACGTSIPRAEVTFME